MNDNADIIKDWAIVTVPRVGSHYLQERIFVHTGKLVLKYHDPKFQTWGYESAGLLGNYDRVRSGLELDKLKLITIARDPKDLLTSEITMGIKHVYNNLATNENLSLTIENVKELADKYYNHYLKLEEFSDIVIDYNQLISFPFDVTCAIANRLKIEIIANEYKTNLKDNIDGGYMVSSRKASQYYMVKNVVEKTDLSNFYEAYNKILSKSITLP